MINVINGLRVYINDLACVVVDRYFQFRFPKSKKQRTRKKWSKRPENWKTTYKHITYKMADSIIMSSKTFREIQESIKNEKR